jgi:hypothetical protein
MHRSIDSDVPAEVLDEPVGEMIGSAPSGDPAVVEIVSCANCTLAELSARIEHRYDVNIVRTEPLPDSGSLGKLVRFAGKVVWARISDGKAFGHGTAEGFLEPATGKYMIDFGSYAEICADGVTFGGRSGRSLQTLRPSARHEGDVLWLLRLLPGATDAHPEGTETLRGTSCRKYLVHVEVQLAAAAALATLPTPSGIDSKQPAVLTLTVWIDGQHIRRVQFEDRVAKVPLKHGDSSAKVLTLELWDFGVPVQELDWSRLPTFRTPG